MYHPPGAEGSLYDGRFEHDACGVGFVARPSSSPSREIITMALEAVVNLTHRGALDADAKTGDGAGILVQIPRRFFVREAAGLGFRLSDGNDLGLAMVFLPPAEEEAQHCRQVLEEKVRGRGVQVLGWRQVPVDRSVLGGKAAATCPNIEQLLVARPAGLGDSDYERALYLARKEAEAVFQSEGCDCYIPSFSHRTVVYKGLFVAKELGGFYRDLQDPHFESALAIFHQRYSTNTFPTWPLSQPFRMLAHNGEINTLQGNINWMRAREPELESQVWKEEVARLRPIIVPGGSDSASLDNALEAITLSGRSILHAMLMLIPEAWENMPDLDSAWRDFYEYHAALIEPWDGPAAIAFTDGLLVGATLDRNGLRPLRYKVMADGLVLVASEVGVIDLDEAQIVEKGRLGPGQMIAVDTVGGRILRKADIMAQVVEQRPYGQWVRDNIRRLSPSGGGDGRAPVEESANLLQLQRAFGCTNEDVRIVIKTMVSEGHDPVWSMGDDTPLAVLSPMRRAPSFYFKQRFAQVTNPPIDPLREELVMSLDCYVGPRGSLFEETPEHARLIHLASPLLTEGEMAALKALGSVGFPWREIPCRFPTDQGPQALELALEGVCAAASQAIDEGAAILILSDRYIDERHAPIPMLLAVGAVHHHLIRQGKRMRADLVVETGAVWDIHHLALLMGYGANGVYPYLLLATARALTAERDVQGISPEEAVANVKLAMERGTLKIMSKMGISALRSYRGAQIFEVIGLAQEVVNRYFTGTPARLGGIGLRELAEDVLAWHREAFAEASAGRLRDIGYVRHRRDGEYHAFNPTVVKTLHQAVEAGDYQQYRRYSDLVHNGPRRALRDLLAFRGGNPIPIDEVEPVEEIRRRFVTAAMSLGALSQAAHMTLAIAMNRMGSRSNTGEGGEDRRWYQPLDSGDWADSRIKQVASGRFGVTTEYLVRAQELEIKMAQGSKPGEGGQLPGHKVTEFIARVRHAIPGIPLISPPPHHDIYSIEDLAQLIHDLKQVNPQVKVGVKLVAESGVGTIAAGVAKAYADYVLISGMDGGTGASPLSSIKNAGCPWELGLAETQQVLVLNGLRGRVRLRTDGGLKTGRDVVVAAMLGAEEFAFGTAAIVALGCDMARQCHLNTCPAGIATQRQDLIAGRFRGTPEMVINYFTFVAQEVREILASLGFRRLDDIVGRVDLLTVCEQPSSRADALNLEVILKDVDPTRTSPRRHTRERNDRPYPSLDEAILKDVAPALEGQGPIKRSYQIRNSHLTVGAQVAGEVARRYGLEGLPPRTIDLHFRGSAGQSFGAFCMSGMRLVLEGEANDYVGKGMSGGEIVIKPPPQGRFFAHENVIVGNTVLYGATGGKLFVAGRAGERFAVRNSGAIAVVEGTGDHCCEYMTSGVVVVLGSTGRNFGAGMSAGTAYVLDEEGALPRRYNPDLVDICRVTSQEDIVLLRALIEEHLMATASERAHAILDRWDEYLPQFWKVTPLPVAMKIDGHVAHAPRGAQRDSASTPSEEEAATPGG